MDSDAAPETAVYSVAFRTKMNIAKAMSRLCAEQHWNKISVEHIAKAAGISRSGFYHHFKDKNAVVQWLTALLYANGIDQQGRTLTWFEGYLATTRGFTQFRPLFLSDANNVEYGAGRPFFIRHRQQTLTETLVEHRSVELTDELAFQIEALPYIEIAMTGKHDEGRYDHYPLKKFCDLLCGLVPRQLFLALDLQRTSGPNVAGRIFVGQDYGD